MSVFTIPYPVDIAALYLIVVVLTIIAAARLIDGHSFAIIKLPINLFMTVGAGICMLICIGDYIRGPSITKEYNTYWTDVIVSTLRGSPTHRRVTTDQEVGCEVSEITQYTFIHSLSTRSSNRIDGKPCSEIRTQDNLNKGNT